MANSAIFENGKKIKTNCLIALCEIENYDTFCRELERLIVSRGNKDLIYKMYRVMTGKIVFGKRKYKDFVKKYQDVIEIMKKNHCLCEMTISKYNAYGKSYIDSTENYFFEYITAHKEDIETIKNLAIKIRKLGFSEIIYDENFDFTSTEYKLDGFGVDYLDNMEIIPTYNNSPIGYKTTDSCYCVRVGISGYGKDITLSSYDKSIKLNNLIFDANRLPSEITLESTVDVIKKLADDSKQEGKVIKELVDVSVAIDDLVIQYNEIERIIESVENADNREQLKQILNNILEEIKRLKSTSSSFRQDAVNDFENLSEEKIEQEKQQYLIRRYNAGIDWC